jgi:formate dehydrogenase subunit gamma
MSNPIGRANDSHPHATAAIGRTPIHDDDLLRHSVYTRIVHWSAAIFFVFALLSGFAIYTPWLYHWLAPLFGGGPITRLLHPWFSLGFLIVFGIQCLNWFKPMSWTDDDRRWMRHFGAYVTNREAVEPEYVGFFNGGQKLYFWAIVACAVIFLVSGVPMWFPHTFGPTMVAISYVLHDLAALLMLVGFIVHIYEATGAQPGTFQAMTRGTVEKRWAWTHHPGWYRAATGRDPRADYARARSGDTRT